MIEIQVNTADVMQPAMIAGNRVVNFNSPFLTRNVQAIKAQGRKNRRLVLLASIGAQSITIVNHRIRRLPPPIPRPDKNPSKVPTKIDTTKELSIGNGFLPTGSEFPVLCEVNELEFGGQNGRTCIHRYRFRSDRGGKNARELVPSEWLR